MPASSPPKPERALPTRWTLVERLKNPADESSWTEFFQIYSGLIYGVALKSGLTEAESQEVLQETLISISKQMPGFKCGSASGSFKGFLLQITSRRIADQFRKRPRHNFVSSTPRDDLRTATIERIPDPSGCELEKLWTTEWEKHSRDAALAAVKQSADPEQFQMFELHVLHGLSVREVARKLGVNPAQVYFAKYKISSSLKTASVVSHK